MLASCELSLSRAILGHCVFQSSQIVQDDAEVLVRFQKSGRRLRAWR